MFNSPRSAGQADRRRMGRARAVLALVAGATLALVGTASASADKAAAPGYGFAPIASLGDPAPGGGQFTFDFEPSAVNNRGEAAFTADVTTGGEGVFVARRGQITQVTRSGLPAPGDGTLYGAPQTGELGRLGFNDRGDVAVPFFLGAGFVPPCDNESGQFRFSHSSQTLSAVAVPGMAAPGGGTFQGVFGNVGMNNRGDIVFPGLATGTDIHPGTPPGCNGTAAALFLQNKHGTLSSVVRPGDQAPGGGVFDDAINGSINNAGDIAFGAHLAGEKCVDIGTPFACGESVYLKSAATGAIRSIAHQGDPAPGGGNFVLAFGGLVDSRDDVAFIGDLTPNGAGGVFLYSHGTTIAVARPGDPMPGGGHLLSAGFDDASYGLSNSGEVAFAASLDTVNSAGIPDTGMYVYSHGSLQLVARTGTMIPGLGTIAYLGYGSYQSFVPTNGPLATGGPINNRGQIPLFATLTDGRGVLLIATPAQ